jgi:hypothetical protein
MVLEADKITYLNPSGTTTYCILRSPRFLVGFVFLDLLFYVYVLWIVVCPFVLFLLAIVLSVLSRFTDSFCVCISYIYIRFMCVFIHLHMIFVCFYTFISDFCVFLYIATCLPADCCFSELAPYKSNSPCWSSPKRTSSSFQLKINTYDFCVFLYIYIWFLCISIHLHLIFCAFFTHLHLIFWVFFLNIYIWFLFCFLFFF